MRLLIVEDDPKVAEFVARGLRAERFAVDVSYDGLDGLNFASTYEYDLAILDLMLPTLSGTDLLQRIRRRKPDLPILVLTARDATEEKVQQFEAGADDYLTKPFDFGELVARLRALIRRNTEAPPPQVVVGDLVIDVAQRRVSRGTRDITLTGREFEFLLYLARNVGRVVSRAELMAQVWEDAKAPYSNIIDVYASRLRRKLDDGEEEALFSTVRGVGFLLQSAAPNAPARRPARARRR